MKNFAGLICVLCLGTLSASCNRFSSKSQPKSHDAAAESAGAPKREELRNYLASLRQTHPQEFGFGDWKIDEFKAKAGITKDAVLNAQRFYRGFGAELTFLAALIAGVPNAELLSWDLHRLEAEKSKSGLKRSQAIFEAKEAIAEKILSQIKAGTLRSYLTSNMTSTLLGLPRDKLSGTSMSFSMTLSESYDYAARFLQKGQIACIAQVDGPQWWMIHMYQTEFMALSHVPRETFSASYVGLPVGEVGENPATGQLFVHAFEWYFVSVARRHDKGHALEILIQKASDGPLLTSASIDKNLAATEKLGSISGSGPDSGLLARLKDHPRLAALVDEIAFQLQVASVSTAN